MDVPVAASEPVVAESIPSAPSEAELLTRLEAAFALRHEDPERGEAIGLEAIRIARAESYPHAAAAADLVLVYCEGIGLEADIVVARLSASHVVFEAVGDAVNLIRSGDLLSTIMEGIGDYGAALRYAEQVLDSTRAVGDRLFEGYALSSLAGIFTATGELELAAKKARWGLAIANEIESPRLAGRLEVRRGRIHRKAGELEAAIESQRRARDLGRAASAVFIEVDALTELGGIAEDDGRLEDAETLLDEARSIANDEVWRVSGPRTQLGLARLYVRTGRLELAQRALHELDTLASGYHMVPVKAEGAALLAEVHERLGHPADALRELRRHIALREQMMESQSQRAVKRYQVKLETAAARRETELERQRYAELQAMQTQLLESERMAAVGGLAAGLAHEMNSPLGVLQSNLDTSRRALERLEHELGEDAPKGAQRALRALTAAESTSSAAATRLESLVHSVRRFTRLDEAEMQSVDLREDLEVTVDLFKTTLPEGVRVSTELNPVPSMTGWPGRLNQAFLTLLVNAADALGESGCIRVQTGEEDGHAVVRISDDGPGIPKAVQANLFEPAFDTRGPRTRFRVGLATVRSVVDRHGGTIDFDTAPGRGTTFAVRFPCGA